MTVQRGYCRVRCRVVRSCWHVPVVTSLTLSEQGGLASLVFSRVSISYRDGHHVVVGLGSSHCVTLCRVCFLQSLPLQ